MDSDEVVRLVNELKFSNVHAHRKTLGLDDGDLQIGVKRLEHCLVAKVFEPKVINVEVLK